MKIDFSIVKIKFIYLIILDYNDKKKSFRPLQLIIYNFQFKTLGKRHLWLRYKFVISQTSTS